MRGRADSVFITRLLTGTRFAARGAAERRVGDEGPVRCFGGNIAREAERAAATAAANWLMQQAVLQPSSNTESRRNDCRCRSRRQAGKKKIGAGNAIRAQENFRPDGPWV
jgi:hypothetical protein